ncbi:MAG: hypothetical protein ACTSRE_04840 [Promethearchaeota archaeon]
MSHREAGYENTVNVNEFLEECAVIWAEELTLLKFFYEHGIIY